MSRKKEQKEKTSKTKEEQTTSEKMEELKVGDLIQEELKKASSDAQSFKDKYYRTLAEMENMRKRLQQEKQEMISYAIDNMLSELLTPLDNLENALTYTDNLSDELQNWAQGFKMITSQFKEVLNNHGVVVFESIGHQFNPHFHEAVETEETEEYEEGTIISETIKGYRHGERVLRVALVKVAKKPSKKQSKKEENESKDQKEIV